LNLLHNILIKILESFVPKNVPKLFCEYIYCFISYRYKINTRIEYPRFSGPQIGWAIHRGFVIVNHTGQVEDRRHAGA
jgi:hypothetical protein